MRETIAGTGDSPPLSPLRHDFALYQELFSEYIWRYKNLFILAVGCMLCAALTSLLLVYLIGPFTDEVASAPQEISPALPILIIGSVLMRALLSNLGEGASQSVSQRVTRDMRLELYVKLLHLPIRYFDRQHSGSLIARFTNETNIISRSVTDIITLLFRDVPTLILMIAFMLHKNWLFAIVVLLCAPMIAYSLLKTKVFLRRMNRMVQDLNGTMISIADEVLAAVRIVRLYGGQKVERGRFEEVIRDYYRCSVNAHRATLASRFLVQVILCVPILLLMAIVILYSQSSLGDLVAFLVVFMMLVSSVRKLPLINSYLQQVLAALDSIRELAQQPVEPDHGTATVQRVRGEIDVRGVCFHYPDRETPALENLNLHVDAGETVALVGASGSGKSTLVSLLCRFYEPSAGRICLDGRDITEYTLAAYRRQLALVSQRVILFNDTVRNNVAYGDSAACGDAVLQQVLDDACINEFLEQLPAGIDSVIGERGALLSGGQRQRIAIARALLKNAPVLILDEATSSLDPASEQYVERAIRNVSKQRTCIIIAHRAATVERAPRILVLKQGRLVGDGNHKELWSQCPEYQRLFMQLQDDQQEPALPQPA